MHLLVNLLIFLGAFVLMEATAWFTHKYVMHGLFWFLHRDHHRKEEYGFWEKNDFFFLIFAIPGIIAIVLGAPEFNELFWLGAGITAYGASYFFIHDIFIHQRIRWLRNTDNAYFRAIRKAHKVHHKHLTKEDGECFGMLWVPMKYYHEAQNK